MGRVVVSGLSKRYKIYPDSWSRVMEWASGGRMRKHAEKWALRGVSFEVPRGSSLGVVGANGAGKSTLLKILAGTTLPTSGTYSIEGRLGSLLELGAGFHPEFSGKDNIFMNAAIMGISKAEVRERFEELAEFAEVGEYLLRPVRTYSSGMSMRLAFAVAMMSRPDVLILDEVLAVGDQHFQKKCMDKVREIRMSGTTVLFVSHSVYHVRQICDNAIWIHDGAVVTSGNPINVTDEYVNFQYALSGGQSAQAAKTQAVTAAAGAPHLGEMKITAAGADEWRADFVSGEVVDIHLEVRNPAGHGRFHVGIIVNRNDDVQIFSSRSLESGCFFEGSGGSMRVRVPLSLTSGEFYVSGYLLDESCEHVIDQRLSWCRFKVQHGGMEKGTFLANTQWIPNGGS
jgi:lipopolysaccharide transport system ATP-binding protein